MEGWQTTDIQDQIVKFSAAIRFRYSKIFLSNFLSTFPDYGGTTS